MSRRLLLAALAAAFFSALSAPALGEEPAAPKPLSEVLQGDARQAYDAARVLHEIGDYHGALLKFRYAYELSGDPRLLWNSASCAKSLRKYVKAIELVRDFLASSSPVVTPDAAERARAFIQAALPLTSRLEVESNVAMPKVYVDGEFVGHAPLLPDVRIDLGLHRIAVKKPGYATFEETLTVAASRIQVTAILQPIRVQPRRAPARKLRRASGPGDVADR